MADNFVELPSLSKWPQLVVFKSIDQLSELYFLQRVWKTVEVTYLQSVLDVVDESAGFQPCKAILENYAEKNLTIGYNPFLTEAEVFLCPTLESVHKVQDELRALQHKYKARVQHAKVFIPKQWTSLGSEEEVDQEKAESTREKISVEWIGCLEKRQTKVGQFVDADATDVTNGYEEITAEDKKHYILEYKTHLQIGVQVDIKQSDGKTQSDVDQSMELEPCNLEGVQVDSDIQSSRKIESFQKSGQISTIDVPIDSEERLNYFKSFVNTEKRQKIIASVAWHPTRLGFVAIAYVDGGGIDSNENTFHVGNKVRDKNLIPDKESAIHDADVTVNEAIFDVLSRKGESHLSDDSDDFLSAGENGVESDEESQAGLPRNFKMSDILIYQHFKNQEDIVKIKPEEEVTDSLPLHEELISGILTVQSDHQHDEDDDKWSSTSSENTVSSEGSRESETGTETTMHSFLNISLYDDDFSDNSISAVDEVPFLDTDSSVLIWNCDNDLFPQMKLYSVYETQIVRFCPINGNFIAGGSSSGQLVVWHLENKFQNPPRKSRLENCNVIREFMENLPLWPTEDEKYPTLHPLVVSDRSICHLYPVTCLEWLHPSLMITSSGALVKVKAEENILSEQIFTSSTDGTIKIWDLKKKVQSADDLNSGKEDSATQHWTLELLYNLLVTNPHADKHWTPVRIFKVFTPSVTYNSPEDGCYQYVSVLNSKFDMMVAVANEIGEFGVIRWSQKKDDVAPKKAERCEHEWWGICHDDLITSISQNYFFPKIMLTVGGHIFALWNIEFKKGPIWWQQYPAETNITEGCFTPFHPGVIYIVRSDGFVDIWDLTKQIHKPVAEVLVSGFSISAFSVSVPPCSNYQVGIADSNGNFHILKNRYDMSWNENDILVVGQFFERAKESRRQLLQWNRTWKQQSTFTDMYGFEHRPQKKKFQMPTKRPEKVQADTVELKKTEEKFTESATFLDKIVQSKEYKEELDQILTKMKFLYEEKFEEKRQEVLTQAQNIVLDDLSVDEIHEKYCS